MRLGFVGVGKHAQKMARAFRECGADIVAFDCATARAFPDGYGNRVGHNNGWGAEPQACDKSKAVFEFAWQMRWEDMIASPDIDAIVCCAPPDVTAEVTLAAAQAGKRVCATKPLLWLAADNLDREVYVDLWRLYSPAWLALKADLQEREISSVRVDFYGNGPVRGSHSGLLDYGPHALAFVLDLGLRPELAFPSAVDTPRALWVAENSIVRVCTGNGGDRALMQVRVETTDGGQCLWHEREAMQTYESGGAVLMQHWRDLALRNFCRAFMRGDDSDTLRISCEAMRLLSEVGPEARAVVT